MLGRALGLAPVPARVVHSSRAAGATPGEERCVNPWIYQVMLLRWPRAMVLRQSQVDDAPAAAGDGAPATSEEDAAASIIPDHP